MGGPWVSLGRVFFVEHPNTGTSCSTYDDQFAVPNACGVGKEQSES
jgi:hypothetical protein